MKAVIRRLVILEGYRDAWRNAQGLTPVDVLRQRICRRQAAETGRRYEGLLREIEMESRAFWESYDVTARSPGFCGTTTDIARPTAESQE